MARMFLALISFACAGAAEVVQPQAITAAATEAPAETRAADPALHLHGHNDYLQPVPLQTALELGLGSVEADVFLDGGELLTASSEAPK